MCLLACQAGCQTAPIPDPNDPNARTENRARVVLNNLHWASRAAQERVAKREISDEIAQRLVLDYAVKLDGSIDDSEIDAANAWLFGEVFWSARDWPRAELALALAAKSAKDEDRRVNDSLRLAEAYANMGQVPKALALCRSTFRTPPREKAPILPAILLRIAPAAAGKGHDAELAAVLEGAIQQQKETAVDMKTQAGKLFQVASRFHIHHAWEAVIQLYKASGHADRAAIAQRDEKVDEQMKSPSGFVRSSIGSSS